MALRNQPYIPLYVQDFQTDEKLIECSASATGVFIRIMCVMHKSDRYGTILLGQNDKQSEQQIKNFASKLVKHLPYTFDVILSGLEELLQHGVLQIEEDFLCQRRMRADNALSEKRAVSGHRGGVKTKINFAIAKEAAKTAANTENEIEDENEIDLLNKESVPTNFVPYIPDPVFPIKTLVIQYKSDELWVANVTKSLSLKVMTEVGWLLDRFAIHLETQKMTEKTEKDFREHFINWARKQKPEQPPNTFIGFKDHLL